MHPPSEALTADALSTWILDSAAGNRNPRQDSPTTIFSIYKSPSPIHWWGTRQDPRFKRIKSRVL